MNLTITLTADQQAAFDKRVTGNATPASLAETIVLEQVQAWTDSDLQSELNVIASDFKTLSNADAKTIKDLAKKIRDGKPKATVKIAK